MPLEHWIGPDWRKSTSIKLAVGLQSFPEELLEIADSLEVLDLSGNQLSSLPEGFEQFQNLRILFLSDNLFTELPAVLGKCKRLDIVGFKANRIKLVPESSIPENLRWLILTDNQIEKLPESLGNCQRLQKLMLAGNQLSELPVSLLKCQRLELIRISANHFTKLPEWLLTLPRLSWLAVAGNPFSRQLETENTINNVPFSTIEIGNKLGEGASGQIYSAWEKENPERNFAVKVFKKNITSDGYPSDEMYASIRAGQHRCLVKLHGKLSLHPEEKDGLLMELIPETFRVLGLPPSFESCTRDNYAEGTRFDLETVQRIIHDVADVAHHLHQNNIIHGDLYPHNTLVDETGNVLLTDFGAASVLDLPSATLKAFQRLESRALGCMMEDLLERCDFPASQNQTYQRLLDLKERCMSEEIDERPLAAEILDYLQNIFSKKQLLKA